MSENNKASTSSTHPTTSSPFKPSWYFLPHETKGPRNNKKMPCLRWGHSSTLIDKSLYIYGGTGHIKNIKQWESIYKLDLDAWDWSRLEFKGTCPPPRDSHSMIAYQNKLYLFGGSSGACLNTLYEYDLSTDKWRNIEVQGLAPSPREGHCCCVVKEHYMLVYGGWNGDLSFNDCFILDLRHMKWLPIKEEGRKPTPRENQSCSNIGDSIYFFGGQGNNFIQDGNNYENFFNDLYKLTLNIMDNNEVVSKWEELHPKGVFPTKRASHASCVCKDRYMFILAGEGYPPEFNEDFTAETEGISRTSQSKSSKIRDENDEGDSYNCYPKNDVWYYDIELNEWHKLLLKNEGEFAPRFVHTADTLFDSILVFGGLRDYHRAATDLSILSLQGNDPFETAQSQLEIMGVPKPSDKSELDLLPLSPDEPQQGQGGKRGGRRSSKKMEIEEEKVPESDLGFKPVVKPLKNGGVTKAMIDRTASKLEKTVVSMNFVYSMASLITSPLSAFGLLVDNALINKATSLHISFLRYSETKAANENPKKKRRAHEESKGDENSNQANPNALTPYLLIEDNGRGWKSQDFLKILLNCDIDTPESIVFPDVSEDNFVEEDDRVKQINEYAFNLKIGCFRLGRTFVFITKHEDEISLGLLSVDKQYCPTTNSSQAFYCSYRKSTGEFLTEHGAKYKKIILKAIAGFLPEDELVKSFEKISTRVIILDLSPVSVATAAGNNTENTELVQKRKGQEPASDVRIRAFGKDLKRLYSKIPNMLIELSLRTYLSYFFLDSSKAGIEIKLNEAPIFFMNIREVIEEKRNQENVIKLNQENLYEGSIVCTKRPRKDEKGKASKEYYEREETFQGLLFYYENRLIRRFENPKLGNFDFLSLKYLNEDTLGGSGVFDTYGYVDLNHPFKPNMTKTEIENLYYSNFLYTEILEKIQGLEELLGKRRLSQTESENESIVKKVKV